MPRSDYLNSAVKQELVGQEPKRLWSKNFSKDKNMSGICLFSRPNGFKWLSRLPKED